MAEPLSILQILEKNRFHTGSVVQMYELARGLLRRGHRVGVVSRPGGEVAERCRAEGIEFFPAPLRHEFDLPSAGRLARLYGERGVDLVHVHKGVAHSVALMATFLSPRRPVLVVNRGVSFPLDRFNRIKYGIRLGAVVAVCRDIREVVVRSGRVPADKVHVIYAGVDLERFDPARTDPRRIRQEWGVGATEVLLVQVSAREWKGWRDLVSAAALLAPRFPRLRTAIVACKDDAEKERVAAFARERGIGERVLSIGFRTDMPDVLSASDIVADLSYEGLGITGTLREAMALGKPVVASAAGGNPELVEDGRSGLLVPAREPEALAAALARLLEAPELAARLARAGQERVRGGFSTEVRLDRIEALYAALTAAAATEEGRKRGRESDK
jgi:glycosyltransferase involved in cell wall biosynthesis